MSKNKFKSELQNQKHVNLINYIFLYKAVKGGEIKITFKDHRIQMSGQQNIYKTQNFEMRL